MYKKQVLGCFKKMLLRGIVSGLIFLLFSFLLYINYTNKSNWLVLLIILFVFQLQMLYRLIGFFNNNISISENIVEVRNFSLKKYDIRQIKEIREVKLHSYQRFLLGQFGSLGVETFDGKMFKLYFNKTIRKKPVLFIIENKKEIRAFEKFLLTLYA